MRLSEKDIAIKRKIGDYLEKTSDPIGEGKFNDWPPDEIASLYYVLFGDHLEQKIPLPGLNED